MYISGKSFCLKIVYLNCIYCILQQPRRLLVLHEACPLNLSLVADYFSAGVNTDQQLFLSPFSSSNSSCYSQDMQLVYYVCELWWSTWPVARLQPIVAPSAQAFRALFIAFQRRGALYYRCFSGYSPLLSCQCNVNSFAGWFCTCVCVCELRNDGECSNSTVPLSF